MSVPPDSILRLLDELKANRKSRRTAWATLQRLRKLLEENGPRIGVPEFYCQDNAFGKVRDIEPSEFSDQTFVWIPLKLVTGCSSRK